MKLHELDNMGRSDKVARILESRLGHSVEFSKLTQAQSQKMLSRVQNLIREHRASPDFHHSERDPAYLKLIMLEQGLASIVGEQQMPPNTVMMAVDLKDPKVQQTMKKAQSGQTLTPDETKLITAIASQKKESKHAGKRMVKESEIQQAQVVLAAQDMVDQIQGMLEDISEMQFKDLPALTNSIKNDMGVEQATAFQSAASAALTQLLTSVQEGKIALEGAQGTLTGQEPVVPGDAAGMPTGDVSAELDVSADLNPDDEAAAAMPPRDDEEDEADIGANLGRERR